MFVCGGKESVCTLSTCEVPLLGDRDGGLLFSLSLQGFHKYHLLMTSVMLCFPLQSLGAKGQLLQTSDFI